MSIIPKIESIKATDVAPRYVWVDEDGNQVSQVTLSFGTALSFAQGWQRKWDKIVERYGEPEDPKTVMRGYHQPMTRSGKSPVELKRIIVRISLEDPTDDEKSVAEAALRLS